MQLFKLRSLKAVKLPKALAPLYGILEKLHKEILVSDVNDVKYWTLTFVIFSQQFKVRSLKPIKLPKCLASSSEM